MYTRAVMDFNFGAAPTGSEPSFVYLNLQNTGSVPAEWYVTVQVKILDI